MRMQANWSDKVASVRQGKMLIAARLGLPQVGIDGLGDEEDDGDGDQQSLVAGWPKIS